MAASYLVFDRVNGERVQQAITYCREEHAVDVMMRLINAEPNTKVQYQGRDPEPGEIQSLDSLRLKLKSKRQKLPGWVTYN